MVLLLQNSSAKEIEQKEKPTLILELEVARNKTTKKINENIKKI